VYLPSKNKNTRKEGQHVDNLFSTGTTNLVQVVPPNSINRKKKKKKKKKIKNNLASGIRNVFMSHCPSAL
jgi:hypothetical protein